MWSMGYITHKSREIRLSPNGKRRDNPVVGGHVGFPFWRYAAVSLATLALLFFVFWFWIHRTIGDALQKLS